MVRRTAFIIALCVPFVTAYADELPVIVNLSANGTGPRSIRLNWSVSSTLANLMPGQTGQFSRPSAAYLGLPDGMTEFSENEPRFQSAAACSITDGMYVSDIVPGNALITPHCVNLGYLLGTGSDMRLYRSADGVQWDWVADRHFGYMYSLASGTLLGTIANAEGRLEVWRSTDNGASWSMTQWADTFADFVWPNPGAYVGPWGFYQAASGTIIMVEYALPWGGRYIYRSADDGQTWRIVHDEYESTNIKHWHAVTKHEGLNRWIAANGDGSAVHHLQASDDDGVTWYDYTQPGERFVQPMAFVDYGDPSRLLMGSDLFWQVAEIDVSDGPDAGHIASAITNWDARPGKNFCFNLFEHNGIFYACQYDNSYVYQHPVISVSRDRIHWAVYHNFTLGENGGYRFCGELNGKLHLAVQRAGRLWHFAISPARVDLVQGVHISPATENLLNSPAASSGGSTAGWMNQSDEIPDASGYRGDFSTAQQGGHHDSDRLHYARTDGGEMRLWSPHVSVAPYSTVRARLWVRGDCEYCELRWRLNYADMGLSTFFSPNADHWQEIVSSQLMIDAVPMDLRAKLTCLARNDTLIDIDMDSFQIEQGPMTPWQLGGSPRAADAWTASLPAGDWTQIFTIQPEALQQFITEEEQIDICTYASDNGDVATVTFDGMDRRFKIKGGPAGGPFQILETSPCRFQRQAQIRFAVRNSAQGLSFAVSNGQPLEHAPGTMTFSAAPSAWRVGDALGEHIFPAIWLDNIVAPIAMSNTALAAFVASPTPVETGNPDSVRIESRAAGGTWEMIASLSSAENSWTDHSGLPGETREYRALVAHAGWWSTPTPPVVASFARAGDLNADGQIDLADLTHFLSVFGENGSLADPAINADFDGNDLIDLTDLTTLLAAFGT